jgi:hypothetical protein
MTNEIKDLLIRIENNFSEEGVSEDLPKLESIVMSLFNSIGVCETLQEARTLFSIINDIQFVVAKLVFKEGVEVSDRLRKFVRDFDRLDDLEIMTSFFNQIKKGEYKF